MILQLVSAANVVLNPNIESRRDAVPIFALTPASDITLTAIPDQIPGQEYVLLVTTTGTTSRTLTFSTGFRVTGTLATGTTAARSFVVKFISDGQNLIEQCRTGAIT